MLPPTLCAILASGTWWRAQIDYLAPPASRDSHATDAFIGSPSLVRVSPGTYLASHDRFFDEATGTAYVLRSLDANLTRWERAAEVRGMYWAQLFSARGGVWLIGTS